jgi:HSP20 family protein
MQDNLSNVNRVMGGWTAPRALRTWNMRMDCREDAQKFYVDTEIPGVSKEDIKVKLLKDNFLNIVCEKKKEESGSQGNWRHEERYFGRLERNLQV